MSKKTTTKDDFEGTYLRLGYAKNVSQSVPKELLELHKKTISVKSFGAFNVNRAMSESMGFSHEDFKSIATFHLMSYLTTMSLMAETKERKEFIKKFQKRNGEFSYPSDTDFRKKDVSNFMAFLSQRMSDLNRIIVQKAQSVYGDKLVKKLYLMSPNAKELPDDVFVHMSDKDLLKSGYTLLSQAKTREIIKECGSKYRFLDTFELDGNKYRKIYRIPELFSHLEDLSPNWAELGVGNSEKEYDAEDDAPMTTAFLKEYEKKSTQGKIKDLEWMANKFLRKGQKTEFLNTQKIIRQLRK